MNTLAPIIAAVAAPSAGALVSLLLYTAIAAIVVWAIIALVRWSGIPIPQPVWIILCALGGILAIIYLGKLFGLLV